MLPGVTYAYNEDMNNDTATANNLHAHVETESQDCDSRYTGGRVDEMTTEEVNEEFPEMVFKDRVVADIIFLHGYGTLTVTPEKVTWNESTEEGYRWVEVTWCRDNCSGLVSWHRDHAAEAAGY